MAGLDLTQLAFIGLVAFTFAALAYVFLFDSMARQKKTEERLSTIKLANAEVFRQVRHT